MNLHERFKQTQNAKIAISQQISQISIEHDLTPNEIISILLDGAAQWSKLAIRFERHGNYTKKGDEE